MKIISKYKDYYDSVQGVMYDSEIKYIRKSIIHELDFRLPWNNFDTFCNLNFIGFCGKIYPLIIFKNLNYDMSSHIKKDLSKRKLIKLPRSNFPDTYISYNLKEDIKIACRNTRFNNISRTLNGITEYVKKLERLNLFEKYQTPIFSIFDKDGIKLDTGPILKEYNFQTQMDPYTAYQELVMWIGNLAVNEYPPQITDNVVMRDKKGFDKWSFKKKPTKHIKRFKNE